MITDFGQSFTEPTSLKCTSTEGVPVVQWKEIWIDRYQFTSATHLKLTTLTFHLVTPDWVIKGRGMSSPVCDWAHKRLLVMPLIFAGISSLYALQGSHQKNLTAWR